VTAALPSSLSVDSTGLVSPLGVDHVMLSVSDIEKSLPYYNFVYGANIRKARESNPERLWLHLEANTRIGLQKARTGEKPRIDHYCIKVVLFRPNCRDEGFAAGRDAGSAFARGKRCIAVS
jgi:hypothetical protein